MFSKKVSFVRVFFLLVILAGGIGLLKVSTSQAARLWGKEGQLNAPLSPPLSSFIHIWTGDGVDNLMPAVAYNSKHDEFLYCSRFHVYSYCRSF